MKSSLESWRDRTAYKLSEAALLITGNNPDNWPDEKLVSAPPNNFKLIYGQMLIDAATVVNEAVESQEFDGEYYTEYALMTDKPAKVSKLTDKDGLTVMVEKHDLLRWLKSKNIPAKFFDDETLTDFAAPERPLKGRERESLHRIIGALLVTFADTSPFKTQEALILHLDEKFDGYEGVSKSNLEKVFPKAKKLIGSTDPS